MEPLYTTFHDVKMKVNKEKQTNKGNYLDLVLKDNYLGRAKNDWNQDSNIQNNYNDYPTIKVI